MKDVARMARHGLLVLTTLGAAGCSTVGSISPLISDTDAQYDSLLVGAWQDSSGEVALIKAEEGGKPHGYSIVLIDHDGAAGHFRAVLGRVANYRVLDLEPERSKLSEVEDGVYTGLLLSLHVPVFIDLTGTELRVRALDYDSLSQHLQREPGAVAHVSIDPAMSDKYVVLTAPTADVQEFFARYLSRAGVLGELGVWRRLRADSNGDRPRIRGRGPSRPRALPGHSRH